MTESIHESGFWDTRYQQGVPPWDLGQAAPGFIHWLDHHGAAVVGKRVAVLGCGAGHDAIAFAQAGAAVTGFDFAPAAIERAQSNAATAGVAAQFLNRNIFDLAAEFPQAFDYVIEHTCFCAIDPSQRDRYVEVVHGILKPQGELLAIFFTHGRPGGPPFGSTPAQLQTHFRHHFDPFHLLPLTASLPKRQGEEHWGRGHARPAPTPS
jgi:SAM-dependent methyltransferase